jgi:hypothetical protein
MREMHPEVPIVLVASGMEPSWMESAGMHGVTPLVGNPTGDRLAEAIEEALAGTGSDARGATSTSTSTSEGAGGEAPAG